MIRRVKNLDVPRWKYWLFYIVTIADALVAVCTFAYYEADWRNALLFSEWMDK